MPLGSRRWFKLSQRVLGRDWPTAYLFVALTVLILATIKAYPFLRALWFSFHNVVGFKVGPFVGLDNYIALWGDERFTRSIGVTLTFTGASVVLKLALGLSAALLLHNLPRFGSVLGGLLLTPYVIPEVVRALAWRMLLDPFFGSLNHILVNVLGVMSQAQPWLSDPRTALMSVIVVNVWAGTPFMVILLLAGLKGIEAEQYDAASVDGANAWRRFLHITLPGLHHVLIVGTLLTVISTFNGFTLTYLLTSGGPLGATRVYPILAFEYGVAGMRTSAGVSVAMMAAPLMLVLSLVLARCMLRRDEHQAASGQDGVGWRVLVTLALPLRLLMRAVAAVFWLANDLAERALLLGARPMRSRGAEPPLSRGGQRRLAGGTMFGLIGTVLFFELSPIYFVVITAFKSELQIQQIRGMFWPDPWTLEQFTFLFTKIRFVEWYRNTTLVALSSTAISVLVAALGAYGMVRLRWRGSSSLGATVLVANLMPGALMVIPMYIILAQLRLINTPWALLVTYPSFVLPFATWLMMGYYRSIPEEIEDAALIDGCNRLEAFFRVVLPLVRPALLAVALFSFTAAWNEFLYAYTFLRTGSLLTLPVGLAGLIVGDIQPWGLLMAASILTAVPVAVIYMVGQRLMVAGLTAGSLKG
ncbi:MAG: ABC transporter permease subunit [Chloroflexi bacterium]|nr:ABC transporter permease subunit [Chloroflexota bacterium]